MLFDRRKWAISLVRHVCLKGVNTINAGSGFLERSEHNNWRVLFGRGKWKHWVGNLVWMEQMNKITGEIYLVEGNEQNFWWFFQEELNTIAAEYDLPEGSEHNHWSLLFDRRKWKQSLESFIWQKEVNTITRKVYFSERNEHNHWKIWFVTRKLTQCLESLICQKEVNTNTG